MVFIPCMRQYGYWLAGILNAAAALEFLTSMPTTIIMPPGETAAASEAQRVAHCRLFTLTAVIKFTPGLHAQRAWLQAMEELCSRTGPGGRRWLAFILRQLLPAAAGSPVTVWVAKTRQLLEKLRSLFEAEEVGVAGGVVSGFEAAMAHTYQGMREQAALCADAPNRLQQLHWLLEPPAPVPDVAPAVDGVLVAAAS